MVKNEGSRVFAHYPIFYYQNGGGDSLKVAVKRTKKEAVVTVTTNVLGEKPFKFSLSPRVTHQSLKLILPMMIVSERENRIVKAIRSEKTKATRARNKEIKEQQERIDMNGTEVNEESTLRLDESEGTEPT